jgi:oxygen-independent coproporphyrinogen III oxidase
VAGTYIHIPFCRKACIYCDFHFSTSLKRKNELVSVIAQEAVVRKGYLEKEPVNTIYLGGGTPSLLTEEELHLIISVIKNNYVVEAGAEITLEANPDDLTKEKLAELKRCGINRLSIGLQSFLPEELRWMNRTHTVEQNVSCIGNAQDAGFENITVDLIYGSKFQTEKTWELALKKIETLSVQHLSCYNLTAEERTVLGVHVSRKKEEEVNEELSMLQFEMLMDWSRTSGFEQYEISNFSKDGFISRHNSAYWKGEKYVGLGPSAHSYDLVSRQWNISNNNLYIKKVSAGENFFEREQLDEKTKLNEYLLTRLRTKWGISKEQLKTVFPQFVNEVVPAIYLLRNNGIIVENEHSFVLSREGFKVADRVASDLMLV